MKDVILETDELEVVYRGRDKSVRALRPLSIKLGRGESLAVVGESGCGKTTLVRAILGLQPPSSGAISLFGEDISELDKKGTIAVRRRCGFIPQDVYGGLPPGLSALDTVREPWDLLHPKNDKEAGKKYAVELMERLGLNSKNLGNRKVKKGLSGGQRQRIAVARALINNPELLLADEPTSMQDISTRDKVIRLLRERVDRGMSLIFVTHDLLLARSIARKTAIFFGGSLCETGNSDDIVSEQIHPYTKALYGAMPSLNEKMVLRTSKDRTPSPSGCPFRKGCPEAMYVCEKTPPMKDMGNDRMVACWRTGN
jgi:oligopeptide/dipeptide ABC transporter ATP-binding protein